MSTPMTKRPLILFGLALVAACSLLYSVSAPTAKAETGSITVGTYSPDQVAQQVGLEARMMQEFQGLEQRAAEAQQNGDQAAMQQIQADAQQIQERVVNEFQTALDAAMPTVAEATGVQIIAMEVGYTADGINTRDITAEMVEGMDFEAPAAPAAPALPIPTQP